MPDDDVKPCKLIGRFCWEPTHWPGPQHEVAGVPCSPADQGATDGATA